MLELLTVFYLYGKLHGSGSLASLDPYRPQYSWQQFHRRPTPSSLANCCLPDARSLQSRPADLWAVVFIYAFIRRDRTLQAYGLLDSNRCPFPHCIIILPSAAAPLFIFSCSAGQ